jgi:hypothetical protein
MNIHPITDKLKEMFSDVYIGGSYAANKYLGDHIYTLKPNDLDIVILGERTMTSNMMITFLEAVFPEASFEVSESNTYRIKGQYKLIKMYQDFGIDLIFCNTDIAGIQYTIDSSLSTFYYKLDYSPEGMSYIRSTISDQAANDIIYNKKIFLNGDVTEEFKGKQKARAKQLGLTVEYTEQYTMELVDER